MEIVMNVDELFTSQVVLIPIIASDIVGGFTSVKYVVNGPDTND